jgi:hypothetical protein
VWADNWDELSAVKWAVEMVLQKAEWTAGPMVQKMVCSLAEHSGEAWEYRWVALLVEQ